MKRDVDGVASRLRTPTIVMAGLVPAIHGLLSALPDVGKNKERKEVVDGRHKAGHDDQGTEGTVPAAPEPAGATASAVAFRRAT